MIRPDEILRGVRVASPCPASWDNMDGDERVRLCFLCSLKVYNLSEMTSEDAARLVSEREGRLCVRYYQRRDGTVLTRDCPVGIRAVRKRLANAVACAFVLLTGGLAYASNLGRRDPAANGSAPLISQARSRVGHIEPFKTVLDWIDPPVIMGVPPPPPPTLGIMMPPLPGPAHPPSRP